MSVNSVNRFNSCIGFIGTQIKKRHQRYGILQSVIFYISKEEQKAR